MNEELLIRFLTKACSQNELVEIERWISTDHANANWLFEMERIWSLKDELHYCDLNEIESAYRRFVRTIEQTNQKHTIIKQLLYSKWCKYAAAIAIVFLLAANIYQFFRDKLSDEIASNTIEVPVGQRVLVNLADGSKVWLNSGSRLSYYAKFDRKNRVVRLDGEGYFEVTTDKKHPFVVNTSMLDIKVLGTKFNVETYLDEDIAVSLLEGQLHIQAGSQTARMEANELVKWSKESGLMHHKNKELRQNIQWTSGKLVFVNEPLGKIAKALERRFGVTIIIESAELSDEPFTCSTQPEPTLEQVLILLKSARKLKYTINERTVYVTK